METKSPNSLSLKVFFGHRLNENDTNLLHQCLELITQHFGPNFFVGGIARSSHEVSANTGDESPLPSIPLYLLTTTYLPEFIDLSTTTNPLSALQAITSTLSRVGESKLSNALDHVLYLCTEDRELGGQGLSPTHPFTDADREKVRSLADSWLYASTYDTQIPGTNLKATKNRKPMTLSEKIFMHHVLPGSRTIELKAGDVVPVSVDWVLASEVSWKV